MPREVCDFHFPTLPTAAHLTPFLGFTRFPWKGDSECPSETAPQAHNQPLFHPFSGCRTVSAQQRAELPHRELDTGPGSGLQNRRDRGAEARDLVAHPFLMTDGKTEASGKK